MNKAIFLISLCLSIFFLSCSKKLSPIGSDTVSESLNIQELDFDYFGAKSKIKYTDGDRDLKGTANIRIKKDSIIWFSLTPGLGVEALRVLITKDSIAIINRLKKVYVSYNFETLSKELNFQLDFELIQAMMLGNLPRQTKSDDLVEKNTSHFIIKQNAGTVRIENHVNRSSSKLVRITMEENSTSHTLNVVYGNFKKVDRFDFPFTSLLAINYIKNGEWVRTNMDINYNKAEIVENKLKFPFNIPQKYVSK